jgi:hypothetical protein
MGKSMFNFGRQGKEKARQMSVLFKIVILKVR